MSLEHRNMLHPRLSLTPDGVSEFTFSLLYLFRNRYNYSISRISANGGFIISGTDPVSVNNNDASLRKKFFMTPCEAPNNETITDLFKTHDYWKNISETVLAESRNRLKECGLTVSEDRDNFDYLYFRKDLAELSGKKFHKKKNLVNQFLQSYSPGQQKLTPLLIPQAMEILEQWKKDKGKAGDYAEAREALEQFDSLALKGYIYFADGKAAGYCLGESVAKGKMFAIHFEKGIEHYKGIYQFMNQAFALALPRFFINVNREQDIGNQGLRQAKMSYRPCGFVKKYSAKYN